MVDIIINGYAKVYCNSPVFPFPESSRSSDFCCRRCLFHWPYMVSAGSEKTAAITHQAMEDMSGSAIEYIRGLSIVKSFGQEGASIESFRKGKYGFEKYSYQEEKGYTPFNCLHLFSLKLASMGIVFICAWQTLNGQMSLAYFLDVCSVFFRNLWKCGKH